MGNITEQLTVFAVKGCFSVFTAAFGAGYFTICHVGYQLIPITDAKNGNTDLQNGGIKVWGCRVIDTVGATGKDDALVSGFLDFRHSDFVVRLDFGIHLMLPYPPCNELVILSAEIQDKNFFFHRDTSLQIDFCADLTDIGNDALNGGQELLYLLRTSSDISGRFQDCFHFGFGHTKFRMSGKVGKKIPWLTVFHFGGGVH